MARRYYRRRTVAVRPKKKWASNIIVWNGESVASPSIFAIPLATNKAQASAPTPSILKTGNFKVTADINIQIATGAISNSSPACLAYIVYVPEGWPTTSGTDYANLVVRHPEWIMATKIMGGNFIATGSTGFGVETLNMSTRLKRNLNSGDSVVLFIRLNFDTGAITNATITGNCRYWTCAN